MDRLGLVLLCLLPILFVVGRAPADITMTAIALLFLARCRLGLGWMWLRTPWVLAALTLWAYLSLASAFAIDPGDSIGRALPFIRFILFAAALQFWLLTDRQNTKKFLFTLTLIVAFVVVDCLYQYVFGVDLLGKEAEGQFRLSGPFNNDVAGTFIAKTTLPLIGWWFAWSATKGHLPWIVGGTLAALISLVIMLTGERMAFGTYGLGLCILVLSINQIRMPLISIGLIAVIGMGTAITTSQSLYQRFVGHTISDLDDFWSGRYGIIFVKAFDVWQSAPLTGVGLKNFRNTCEVPNFGHKGPVDTWCFTHAHNPYIELLAETGLIGFGLFLAMISLILHELSAGWRRSHPDFPLVVGTSASLLLFLWPLLISKSLFSNWNAMLFWLMIGLALALPAAMGRTGPRIAGGDGPN